METIKIYSKNAAYQKFEVLKTNRNKRHKYGEFIAEGVRNINGAVKNGWNIVSFIYPDGRKLSTWAKNLLGTVQTQYNYELTGGLMGDLSAKDETSELLAVVRMKNETRQIKLSNNPVVALFDRPSNKGNLGSTLRSCDAFGVESLIITGHAVDIYDPDVISASMGSFFNIPFIRLSDNADIGAYISSLRESHPGIKVIGTSSHASTPVYDIDMTSPVMFLIGNETDGLNRHLSETCDIIATIPMGENASSSLNVSCAASVLFYEASRQRGKK